MGVPKDDVRASLGVLESRCDGNELAEQAFARVRSELQRLQAPKPLARPDPLSNEQWRVIYEMVVARYQYEVKEWNRYRLRKADAPFTGATPVPPIFDESVSANMYGIMIVIAKHLGLML